MQRETAETIALEALGWLAAHPELMPIFMGSTGASADDLRRAAEAPEILAGVLDFICMDDEWVNEFAVACGLPGGAPERARQVLAGDIPHWT